MKGDVQPIELMARREDWQEGVTLYARQAVEGEAHLVTQPLVWERQQEPGIFEPFTRLAIQTAQQLMDELWQCGLRPSEGTGSAGSLKATERHLDDMRKLVFKAGVK